uniref:Uncharacterized protein n=1 Tax=Caulobacter phage BL57 TaxID=3348355 RepID=A0AB74UGD6_9VIRU
MSVNYYVERYGRVSGARTKITHIGQWANGRFLFSGSQHRTTRDWRDALRALTADEKIVSENGVVMTRANSGTWSARPWPTTPLSTTP